MRTIALVFLAFGITCCLRAAAFADEDIRDQDQVHLLVAPITATRPPVTVIKLKRLDGVKAAKKLGPLLAKFGDVKITAHADINTIFIQGSEEQVLRAKSYLHRLDEEPRAEGLSIVRLESADAVKTVAVLNVILSLEALLLGEDRDFYLTPDMARNSVIISASMRQTQKILEIIRRIDEQHQ